MTAIKQEPDMMDDQQVYDSIRRDMESALSGAGVWHIHSVGWKDENTADSEFVGHALWQTAPALDVSWDLFTRNGEDATPAEPPPAEWLKLLTISAADFEGLMSAARMSIGQFLIQKRLVTDNEFYTADFMELHWMSAVIYLATASERLRDFFIAAAFRLSREDYARRGKKFGSKGRGWYSTPFFEAAQSFASSSEADVIEALRKLTPIAQEIQELRDRRNELIHELATSMGHRERDLLNELSLPPKPIVSSYEELQKGIQVRRTERKKELDDTTDQLRAWYMLLLRTSNEAFVFEHRRRNDPT